MNHTSLLFPFCANATLPRGAHGKKEKEKEKEKEKDGDDDKIEKDFDSGWSLHHRAPARALSGFPLPFLNHRNKPHPECFTSHCFDGACIFLNPPSRALHCGRDLWGKGRTFLHRSERFQKTESKRCKVLWEQSSDLGNQTRSWNTFWYQ